MNYLFPNSSKLVLAFSLLVSLYSSGKNAKMENSLLSENDQYLQHYELPKVAAISYYDAAINYARTAGNKGRELKYTTLRIKLED
jgi:hypothetical protein